MAGWRPVGRLVGLAGAVARRLSWGTMGLSCIPGGSVRCRVRGWDAGDGRCRGGGRQALTGTRRGSRCFGRCRCHCGVRGGLRLAAYRSSRLASGVGGGGVLGPYGGGFPGGRVQRGARGGRHVDIREELVGVQRFGAADLHSV